MPELTPSVLTMILDTSPVAIVVFGSDAKVLYANKHAVQLFGKGGEVLKGLSCGTFINCKKRHSDEKGCGHTPDCKSCLLFNAIRLVNEPEENTKISEGEAHFQRDTYFPDLWVKYKAQGIEVAGRKAAILSLSDITESKKHSEILSSTLAELEAIHENVPIPMVLIDRDRRIRKANNTAEQFAHRSAKEMVGLRGGEALRCVHHYDSKQGCGFGSHCSDCKVRQTVEKTFSTQTNQADVEAWIPFDKIDSTEDRCLQINTAYIKFHDFDSVLLCAQDITERKQAEAALLLRESYLSAIIENLPGLLWLKDTEGRFLTINSKFAETCSEEEPEHIVSKRDLDLWPPELADKYCEDDAEVLKSGMPMVIEETILSQGQLRWFETFKNPVCDNQGLVIGLTGYAHDITDRILIKEELKKSISLLEASLESTADGILIVGKHRKCSQWNQKFAEMWNIPDEILARRDDEELVEYFLGKLKDPEQFTAKLSELYEQPEQSSVDQIDFLDGRIFERHSKPQKIGDTVVGRVWSFRDVTERKRAEEALKENEKRYRQLFNSSTDAVFVHLNGINGMLGRFVEVNDVACRRLGYSREELLQMSPADIDELNNADEISKTLERLSSKGSIMWETVHSSKDGRHIPVEMHNRLFDYHGTEMILASARDITERKQAEEEREKLQNQLLQAQKMESVGRLAGGVAHDFNNMLMVILGHSEMAMDQIAKDSLLFSDLQEINNAAERSADITRQLLAFARKQTIAPKVVDLNRNVEGITKMLQRLIGEDIALIWKPGYDLWDVKIDPSQLDQILANLCVNGRDAISDVGSITIETKNVVVDEGYCEKNVYFVPGEYVMISVTDTGHGIEKSELEIIFEPFYTTKAIGKGTGLGLATVYGIVKQNNGFTNVYSELNRGTTFKVYLPRHKSDTAQDMAQQISLEPQGGDESILLVEDEPTILDVTTKMLQRLGYSVTTAATPQKAIQVVENFEGKIDLLLTDLVMPEMNGKDLSKKLLEKQPEMQVLFMSGYTANVIAQRAVLDEGVNFIQKPFSKKNLSAKIRMIFD